MIRISEVTRKIIAGNSFLKFGMSNKLFNLSCLAKFLKPLIETRIKKEVTKSAILMNLSRWQKMQQKNIVQMEKFKIENVTIYGNLCIYNFYKTPAVHDKINEFYRQIQEQDRYITFTEGIHEITLITEASLSFEIEKTMPEKPKRYFGEVSAVVVKFHPKYVDHPGMLYFLIQQITLQNINILEILSTLTELIFYIKTPETRLAFETLQNCFVSS